VRVAILAVAVLLAAWFGLGVRQARDVAQATAIVSGSTPLTAAQARHASDLLHAAAFLNPDRQVDVLRARVDLGRGNEPGARAILKRVVSQERSYLEAWIWLARASVGDLRDFYAAAYRIQQLLGPVRGPR
jgi:predicted Zn-dependent protease